MSNQEVHRVRDAMHATPTIIDGLASVQEAISIMEETGLHALVIDKRDEDDEYGQISVSTIADRVFARNRSPKRVSVYEVMIKPALIVPAKMRVRYAIRLLTRLGVKNAIVTEEDKLVGLVSLRCLVLAENRVLDTDTRSSE